MICMYINILLVLFYFLIYEPLTQRKLLKFQVFDFEIERKMCVMMYIGDSVF